MGLLQRLVIKYSEKIAALSCIIIVIKIRVQNEIFKKNSKELGIQSITLKQESTELEVILEFKCSLKISLSWYVTKQICTIYSRIILYNRFQI